MPSKDEIDAAAQASLETCIKYYTSQFTMSKAAINALHTEIAKAALLAAERVRNERIKPEDCPHISRDFEHTLCFDCGTTFERVREEGA